MNVQILSETNYIANLVLIICHITEINKMFYYKNRIYLSLVDKLIY